MRDIRGDLQDRANLLDQQIRAERGQFDTRIEQLKREHETKLEGLKSALGTLRMVVEIEGRRFGSSMSANKALSQPGPPSQSRAAQEQPQQPLSDTLIRKVRSVGIR
jgi:hypothetical protein